MAGSPETNTDQESILAMSGVVVTTGVTHRFGGTAALSDIALGIPAGSLTGLVGPDGAGKSTLLSLIAGSRKLQAGTVRVLGGDMSDSRYRTSVCSRVAYMPQGLGRNLYPTLSVLENVDFFGRLFGQRHGERQRRTARLLESTGLAPFRHRPAGKLSGGMKQKLGLCCALIHEPDLLILDEPTTGLDPLSRRQFWELIARIRAARQGISVLVATADMDEVLHLEHVIAMDMGKILAEGSVEELMARTGAENVGSAFIRLLPEERRRGHNEISVPPRVRQAEASPAIEAQGLTRRFGTFTAVDHVSFSIERGEIFGFLGSNGCGKTTTMKMLTGLLAPTEGEGWLFGTPVDAHDIETRRHIGFMSQSFSLYRELTVRQNLRLHARLFHLPAEQISPRMEALVHRFGLYPYLDALPDSIPMGIRQRLSLAVAVIHRPEILILDEPTSGVDPVARDSFWELLIELSRNDGVTIFLSTHFMDEAARCDRISLMHAGRVLAIGAPNQLIAQCNAATLEEAFIQHLEQVAPANPGQGPGPKSLADATTPMPSGQADPAAPSSFDIRRMYAYCRCEALELLRDPVRLLFALIGTPLLMVAFGYGISLDVENLPFAVLDRDRTPESREYIDNIASSGYFHERAPLHDLKALDRRMREGELDLAIEIPPGFGQGVQRGTGPEVAAWIDGSNPFNAETVKGYVQGLHRHYLEQLGLESGTYPGLPADVQPRFLYNQDFKSAVAMVPGLIGFLLIVIPAMLTAVAVVREKELGSIVNFYATPVTRLEFLLGKQLPYILLGLVIYGLLVLMAVTLFAVPLKGSFFALTVTALLYVSAATGIGILVSSFTTSQIAALFAAAIITYLPTTNFAGLIDPVSSLTGGARVIGENYPATYFIEASVAAFSKGLGFEGLLPFIRVLLIMAPLLTLIGVLLLRRQEA